MLSIFSKIRLVDQPKDLKPCTKIYLQNIANCINWQLPIVIFKQLITLDMHHRKTYVSIHSKIELVENCANKYICRKLQVV